MYSATPTPPVARRAALATLAPAHLPARWLAAAAAAAGLLAWLAPSPASADEGMWTYDNFPRQLLEQRHGVKVDDAWLEHVRLSSARLARGCSGSFVSPQGLVMTNHHCAHECIEQVSTKDNDRVKSGFLAATLADEPKCPGAEINQLVGITDVTARVRAATKGLTGQRYNDAEKAETARIEKECATSDAVRCDVVSLYRGGVYSLYRYRRFQDVRLVFAPEFAIAFFGGDPDNFNFPRFDLDVSFLRVYEDGKPAKLDHFLLWSKAGTKEGDATFVSGHPGGTSRQLTVAQLTYARDVALPARLLRLAELRGVLTEYQRRGAEQQRHSNHVLFSVENSFKAMRGRHAALLDAAFFAKLTADEAALRSRVDGDPSLRKEFGGAWAQIAKAQARAGELRKEYAFMEGPSAFMSDLFDHARTLLRAGDERPKPLATRFREFRDSAIPAVKQRLLSPAPIHTELEVTTLTFSLTKLREELGADHPFVKKVLGRDAPEDLAARLVKGSTLIDAKERERLWEGGRAAVAASKDPMIALARLIDGEARRARKTFEDEVEAPLKQGEELLARARFAALGTSVYPDATFTLRLSFGKVAGWEENGRRVAPYTTLGGAFDRATGRPPFELPPSWLGARKRLNLKTSFNLVTTNDIIGGNSGSPVVNARGEVVGLIFDGNLPSLGGDYGFDERVNRAVSVDSRAIVEALRKVYDAGRLADELRSGK
jgi:hypothetical protein